MRTLFLLLLLITATPSFACVQTFFVDPPRIFVDERAEAVVSGLCGSSATPFHPLVRVEGSTVIVDFAREPFGLAVPVSWGERVRLPSLFPGQYPVVVQINGVEVARQTLVVRDRPFRVLPAFADAGQKVLIEGIPLFYCHAGCEGLVVRFGNTPALEVELSWEGILAMVPPGTGVVDVTVETPKPATYVLEDGFSHGPVFEDAFDRVLFPVNFIGAGAHGSQWVTHIRMRNDAPVDAWTVPALWIDPESPILPIPFPFIPPRGRTGFVMRPRDGGEFFHVAGGLESSLAYSAHIVDLSRSTTDLGTEMPVVRAEDTAPELRLLEVPVEERYRARLRVYDYEPVNGRQVVILFKDAEGAFITTRELTLTGVAVCVTAPCYAQQPAFGVLDLDQIPELRGRDKVDVTVASLTREARIWAFVSVTNNETQAVTLYSPQHRTRAQ